MMAPALSTFTALCLPEHSRQQTLELDLVPGVRLVRLFGLISPSHFQKRPLGVGDPQLRIVFINENDNASLLVQYKLALSMPRVGLCQHAPRI
jgi:hypothetical protein